MSRQPSIQILICYFTCLSVGHKPTAGAIFQPTQKEAQTAASDLGIFRGSEPQKGL